MYICENIWVKVRYLSSSGTAQLCNQEKAILYVNFATLAEVSCHRLNQIPRWQNVTTMKMGKI